MRSAWKEVERRIASVTKSGRRPVAVTFLDGPPAGASKFDGMEPSGCHHRRQRRPAVLRQGSSRPALDSGSHCGDFIAAFRPGPNLNVQNG